MGQIILLIFTHVAAFVAGVFVYRNNIKKAKKIADNIDVTYQEVTKKK